MSKTLVLHIGPGKCGSSSIQHFFASTKRPSIHKLGYWEVPPTLIQTLETDPQHSDLEKLFFKPIRKLIKRHQEIVLSHEFFFQNPQAIKAICEFARPLVNNIKIVGFSRNQSQWLVSAFNQWIFRSQERLLENDEMLKQHGLNPIFFTHAERHLLAGILSDFHTCRQLTNKSIFNWLDGYQTIQNAVEHLNVSISVGVVPTKEHPGNLIEDFFKLAGLSLHPKAQKATLVRTNSAFSSTITEALAIGISSGKVTYHPHQQNEALHKASQQIPKVTSPNPLFTIKLQAYIDGYFESQNAALASQFNLAAPYFQTSSTINKTDIKTYMEQEQNERKQSNVHTLFFQEISSALLHVHLKV